MPPINTSSHTCQFSWVNKQLLLLRCSWHRLIIWTACLSFGSIYYYPHSFSLSFQLPLTLSCWPCSCFLGNTYFVLFIPYLIQCLTILANWRSMQRASPAPWTFNLCKSPLASSLCIWIFVCCVSCTRSILSMQHVCRSWTLPRAMSSLFGFYHLVFVFMRVGMCVLMCTP